jgi:hypothetical protein
VGKDWRSARDNGHDTFKIVFAIFDHLYVFSAHGVVQVWFWRVVLNLEMIFLLICFSRVSFLVKFYRNPGRLIFLCILWKGGF